MSNAKEDKYLIIENNEKKFLKSLDTHSRIPFRIPLMSISVKKAVNLYFKDLKNNEKDLITEINNYDFWDLGISVNQFKFIYEIYKQATMSWPEIMRNVNLKKLEELERALIIIPSAWSPRNSELMKSLRKNIEARSIINTDKINNENTIKSSNSYEVKKEELEKKILKSRQETASLVMELEDLSFKHREEVIPNDDLDF